MPTNFAPGTHGTTQNAPRYNPRATNVGGAAAPGPITVTDTLPAGLTPAEFEANQSCAIAGQSFTCTFPEMQSGSTFTMGFAVDVESLPDQTTVVDEATISGPGSVPARATTTTAITSAQPPFGLLEGPDGLAAQLTEADGAPAAAAGSHPAQLTVNLGFQSKP